ncbi:MAG: hypothetical protein IJZ89_02005 [Clostridia bacterium]|nr:hypothetical protein [Clostridia bacterium]
MKTKNNSKFLAPNKAFQLFGAYSLHEKNSYDFLRTVSKLDREEAASMFAVRDCIKALRAIGEKESLEAMNKIYFNNPDKSSSGSITRAVTRFALAAYLDERTVYRRIERASKIYLAIIENNKQDIAA